MDVSQYLEIFIDETQEHLQDLSQHLMILEEEPENADTINEIFRAAHSLKGMAGTMGYKRMQHLTHIMENVFSEIRNGKMNVTSDLVDILFDCLDALQAYLDNIQQTADEGTEDNEPIIARLNAFLESEGKPEEKPAPAPAVAEEAKAAQNSAPIDMKFEEFEVNAIKEALAKKFHVYKIDVKIDESCILKAARAFLVFKAIEELGEIVKSNPSVQDIEDEKFEFEFCIIMFSQEELEKVTKAVENVSEIKEVKAVEITEAPQVASTEAAKEEKEPEEETKQKSKAETETTAPAKANASAAATPAKAKTTAPGKTMPGKPVVSRSVRVDIEKLDVLMNLVSELIIAKNGLVSASSSSDGAKSQGFNEEIEYLERVTTNLHESVMKVRMMPIETVTQKYPKMIRDLSKKLNKQMKLYITGEDTELDRTVIDEIGDPLMHLLRNSADHGLENAELRVERGKDPVGNIYLNAFQDGNSVIIEVRDDGNGIDIEKVRNKALEKGTITQEQAEVMTDIVDLLFRPSFSTSEKVTDVSGRGVGLDVVKTKIEALGGDIDVKTALGEGSCFSIRLPLTLAIIQALMVELGEEKYAIPLETIQTIEDISVNDIKYVQSKEVINLRGSVIPIVRLDTILEIEPVQKEDDDDDNLTVVIINKGDKQAGLVVDRLIGQQEIVIKSLGKYINNNSKIISGATILGDGEVALILDVNTLV